MKRDFSGGGIILRHEDKGFEIGPNLKNMKSLNTREKEISYLEKGI